ncbi:unnamed protein product [Urochloa decumbens]|uniref:DUF1618 domain-containing protein n=1 Tax=Urochloa decumbens TaxID=240449 RepID=A0ABC9DZU9_9POAL
MSSNENKRLHHEVDGDDDTKEILANTKLRRTMAPPHWLLLDRHGYSTQPGEDDAGSGSLWAASAITSRGVRFRLSLRAQEPPGVSRLLHSADVPAEILRQSAAATCFPGWARFRLTVRSSDGGTVLLETNCGGGTDYFVMGPIAAAAGAGSPAADTAWYVSFFSSSTGSWRRKAARLPPELAGWHHQWEVLAVLACGGRFWWLDLRRGLLSCSCDSLLRDEDGQQPHPPPPPPPVALEFTLLPHITMEQAREAGTSKYPPVQDRRVTAGAGGRLRYVALRRHRPGRSEAGAPEPPALCDGCRGGTITTWTLGDDRRAWVEDRTVSVADVWRGESYRSTGLPRNAPGFPLLDPFDPDVVYLSVMEEEGRYGEGHELCVDLRTKEVKSCSGRYKGLNYLNDTLEPVSMASSRSREP